MKIAVGIMIVILLSILTFIKLNKFSSAFEADQVCHFDRWELYKDKEGVNCDHDLETRQWILYEIGTDHQPAKILKFYHY